MACSECGRKAPESTWVCPDCGGPVEPGADAQTGDRISKKGLALFLVLFVLVPVLLFLAHMFVPGM